MKSLKGQSSNCAVAAKREGGVPPSLNFPLYMQDITKFPLKKSFHGLLSHFFFLTILGTKTWIEQDIYLRSHSKLLMEEQGFLIPRKSFWEAG